MTSKIRPGEMSPGDEWASAQDTERDSRRDDERVDTWLIDLKGPSSEGAELDSFEARERELRRELKLAQVRVGRSDEHRMRWLLRFAALGAENSEDLRYEILTFAVPPSARFVPCEVYATSGELDLGIGNFLQWLRSGLDTLKEGFLHGHPVDWSVNAPGSHHFTWRNGRLLDKPSIDDGILTEDRFKAQVCSVLTSQGHRIRFCRKCAKLFLGQRRQAYCDPKCSQITRTKRYRERHPEKIRDQRHEAHVRKQQQHYGPKVKVARRPRKAQPRSRPAGQDEP